jgi:hypothetical protein
MPVNTQSVENVSMITNFSPDIVRNRMEGFVTSAVWRLKPIPIISICNIVRLDLRSFRQFIIQQIQSQLKF